MLIEYVEIKNKRGVGVVVLLALLMITSLFALILLLARHMPRLNFTPEVRLFGRIPFGGVILWGAIILTLGLFSLIVFMDSKDWAFFWLVVAPMLLTGTLLLCSTTLHGAYRAAADELLFKIARHGELRPGDMVTTVKGIKFSALEMAGILAQLRESGAIDYIDYGEDNYEAYLVDPNLIARAAQIVGSTGKVFTAPVPQKISWTCSSCGAPNTTLEEGCCEYCGAAVPKKRVDKPRKPGTITINGIEIEENPTGEGISGRITYRTTRD